MKKLLLIDTGPLVAYFDRADAHHDWAVAALSSHVGRIVTCQPVLAEAWHLLGRANNGRDALLRLIEEKLLGVELNLLHEVGDIRRLIRRYANIPMSLTDACMVRLAEAHRAPVCTLDSDFRVYRLSDKSAIDVVSPS